MTRWATAIRCRAFMSPGAPAPASSSRSSGGRARRKRAAGSTFKFRHRVDALTITNGTVDGVSGAILEPDHVERGKSSSRNVSRRLHAARAGGDRHLRRHRRQSRSGPAELAEAARRAAAAHDLRRARTCRRPHDRHHRGRRRAADQPRPHVALRRGHPELDADLAAPRHPHPARSVVDVVRRHGKRLPAPLFPGSDTLGQLAIHHDAPATTIPGSC